jgi:cytidylate kinase
VVFPDAAVKFYLDAPQSVRERRRLAQLRARGAVTDAGALQAEVGDRDRSDIGRLASPLRVAADAHLIDTSVMDVDAMIQHALAACRDAGLVVARAR